jgi:hypothetical protein
VLDFALTHSSSESAPVTRFEIRARELSRREVMPVVETSAYAQAEDALNLTRSLMNDAAGVVFTDAVLLPFLNSAYGALQRELAETGASILTDQMDLDLPLLSTGITPTAINDASSPQLPTDLLVPHQLWEMPTGSCDVFVPMEKITSGLPNMQPSSFLQLWEWLADSINLVGATQATTVRIRYEKALPEFVYNTDPILIRSAQDPLAYAAAALAARSRGARALAADFSTAAEEATQQVIERYVRAEQFKGRRRKPYGYRHRIVYL